MTMLNENHITDLLATYFLNNNYEIMSKLTTVQRGIDLIVKDARGVALNIEIKGETSARSSSKRFGKPFSRNQINNHIGRALLSTFKTMNSQRDKHERFGIAFPDTVIHEEILTTIKPILEKLAVSIYLVSINGVRIL